MSCCSGNCGCGSGCKCGSSCGGCKMYPDLGMEQFTSKESMIIFDAPQKRQFNEFEMESGSETGGCGCKCGSSCNCDNCGCSK